MEKTYKVAIEVEVTANNEDEALVYAANDITELNQIGTLQADIKEIEKELICECGNDEFYGIYQEKGWVVLDGKSNILTEGGMEEYYLEEHRKCTGCGKSYTSI